MRNAECRDALLGFALIPHSSFRIHHSAFIIPH
jgi:hypothetical protein